MSLLAEKLKSAGADTLGAEFTVRLTECVRRYPDSAIDAWRHLGEIWGFAKARAIMKDMGGADEKEKKSPRTPLSNDAPFVGGGRSILQPYRPRPKPDPVKIAGAQAKVVEIMFGYKIGNRDIADLGAHELDRIDSDGALCREIKKELGVLTGNMRFAKVRELITVEQFSAARARASV